MADHGKRAAFHPASAFPLVLSTGDELELPPEAERLLGGMVCIRDMPDNPHNGYIGLAITYSPMPGLINVKTAKSGREAVVMQGDM